MAHGQRVVDLFDEAVENMDYDEDGEDDWIDDTASTVFAKNSEAELRAVKSKKKTSGLEEEVRHLKAKVKKLEHKVEKLRKKYKKAKKEKKVDQTK